MPHPPGLTGSIVSGRAAAARPLRAGRRTHERRPMNTTTVTTPNELEIRVERIFDAPRAHVFSVWTDPDLIPEWRGGRTRVPGHDVPSRGADTLARLRTEVDCSVASPLSHYWDGAALLLATLARLRPRRTSCVTASHGSRRSDARPPTRQRSRD